MSDRFGKAQYEQLVSMIADIVWRFEVDVQGRFVDSYISPVADRLLGLPAGTINNSLDTYLSFIEPDDLPAVREMLFSGLCGVAQETVAEYRLRKPDGTMLWVRSRGSAYIQPDGHYVGFGTTSDITELKQTEKVLRESECYYREIIDSAADAIFVHDVPGGNIIDCNRRAYETLGYSREEVLHLTVRDIDACFSQERDIAAWKNLKPGMTATLEGFYMRKDRSVFPVEVNIVVITRAGKNMVVAVARDITERERAEIALRESEELFESLVDNIDLGISLIDSDYTIVAANSAQAHLSDKDADDLCGKKCYREFEKRDAVCTHCPGTKAMATGQSADVETVGTRDDGSHFDVRLRAFPWHGADGATAGFVEVVEDITKLKESQKALQEAKESAEAANCAKSAFLTNMSHEIRTPMTAILGYADLILDAHVERTIQEHAAVIKHYGEHLLKLIGGILDLSKIEAGKLQIEPTRCSLGQVVADVSSLMRAQATAKQLVLKTEFVPPLPETVFTDPLRLRQILVNLVGNAIKFTDQGEISLAVRLSADNGRVRLCFDVTDTGIGMNEEQIGKLFKPFSQADTSNTRKFSGTGLGLCISKHLAETLGGTIKVCSKPGMGSTFSVTIDPGPLDGLQMIVDAWKATTEHPPTAPPTDARKIKLHGRILLAEDMMANQRLISVLLTRAGADVMAVENGQLAVEAALAACEVGKSFDVILMDMQMPVMDGYEATWQLRRQGYTGPIVALTAHAMAEDCQKCLDVGCDDYATKPIDREKFLATIAHWLSRTCGDGPLLQDDAVSCERQNRDARF